MNFEKCIIAKAGMHNLQDVSPVTREGQLICYCAMRK